MSSRRKEVAEWLLERIRFFSDDCGISIHALFTSLDLEFTNPPLPQALKNEAYASLVKRPDIHFGHQEINVNNRLRDITLEKFLADQKLARKKIFIDGAEGDRGGLWDEDEDGDDGGAEEWDAAVKSLELDPRLFGGSANGSGSASGTREGTESSEREVLKSIEQPDREVTTPGSSRSAVPEVTTIDERRKIRSPEPTPLPTRTQPTQAIAPIQPTRFPTPKPIRQAVIEVTVSPEPRHSHVTSQQLITRSQNKAKKSNNILEETISEVLKSEVPAIVEPKPTPGAVESANVAGEPNTEDEPNLDRRDSEDSIVFDTSSRVTADDGNLSREEDPVEEAGESITVKRDTIVQAVTASKGTISELTTSPQKRRGRPSKNQQTTASSIPSFQTPTKKKGRKSSLDADNSITNANVTPPANRKLRAPSRSHRTPIIFYSTPPKSKPVPKAPKCLPGGIRPSIFTPQEVLDREEIDAKIEAGETGVYLNPTVPRPPGMKGRRPMLVLFKSEKLKDPNHLENNKGSWIEPLAAKMATAALEAGNWAVETSQKPKRKWTRRVVTDVGDESVASNSPSRAKRQRTENNAEGPKLYGSFTPSTATNENSTSGDLPQHIQASTQNEAPIPVTQQLKQNSIFHVPIPPTIVAATSQPLQMPNVLPIAQPNQNTPVPQSGAPSYLSNPFLAHLHSIRSKYTSPSGAYMSPYAPMPSTSQVETPSQPSASPFSIPQPSMHKSSTPTSNPTSQYPAMSASQPSPSQSQHLGSFPQPRIPKASSRPTSTSNSRTPTPIITQPSYQSPYAQEEADGSPSEQLQAELLAREEHGQSPPAISWNHDSIPSNDENSTWSDPSRPPSIPPLVNTASTPMTQSPYNSPFAPQYWQTSPGYSVGITTSKILNNEFFTPPRPAASYKSPYESLPVKAQETDFSNGPFNASTHRKYSGPTVDLGINPPLEQKRKCSLGQVVNPLMPFQGPDVEPEAVEAPALNKDVPQKRIERSTESDILGNQTVEMKLQLSVAESTLIPGITARISCIHNGIIGNLLLSEDKYTIIFLGTNQRPPLVPILILPISKITQNPTLFVLSSHLTELHINALDNNDASVLHKFAVFSMQSTNEAMNNMRSKIVVAMITTNLRGDVPPEVAAAREEELLASAKPFKCETCGSRWKNKEGIDYHLRKSNTTCNPNFVPTDVKRRPYTHKKKITISADTPQETLDVSPSVQVSQIEDEDGDEDAHGEDQDSSSESEDSIFEWAEQVSKNKKALPGSRIVERSVPAHKKRKLYRSIPTEVSLLQEVVREVSGASTSEELPALTPSRPQNSKQSRKPFSLDELTAQRARDILLDLVNENDGFFPGDRGLWYAFVGVWLLKYASSGILPESKLCQKVLDDLVENGQLKQVTFTFLDKRQRVCPRSIITKPDIDPKAPQIDELEKIIAASYPGHYVPARFAPPEAILSKLRTLTGLANQPVEANDDESERPRKRRRRSSSVYEEPMEFTSETPISEDELVLEDVIDELEPEDLSDDDFIDSSVNRKTRLRDGRDQRTGKRRLSAKQPRHTSLTPQPRKRWRKPGTVPLAPEEKERRAHMAATRLQSWKPAPAFLPNPKTGAWNQTPLRVKKSYNPQRKPRLPEPITYMQDENGAWSVRPFGHGVKPIFARPSRRADGNPNLQSYLNRVENGHRPIIMPTKNRQYLPAVPSKALLRKLAASPVESPSPPALEDDMDDDDLYQNESAVDEEDASQAAEAPLRSRRRNTRRVSGFARVSSAFANNYFSHPAQYSSDTVSKRRTRNATRTGKDIREAKIPEFNQCRVLPAVSRPQNPGLASLPSGFGLGIRQGLPAPQKVSFLPPNMQLGVEGDDHRSLVVPADHSTYLPPPANIKWLEESASTLLTLPYNELSSDEDGDVEARPAKRQRIRNRRLNSAIIEQTGSKRNTQNQFKSRVLTAYVQDLEGIMDDPIIAASELGVQVVGLSPSKNRKKYVEGDMPAHLEARLIIACVMLRTLLGGLDLQIDWVIVGILFPGYAIGHLKKAWTTISETKKITIDKFTLDFQDAFLPAYEKGEVAPIDYDHLPDYDWEALVDWAMKNLDMEWTNKTNRLPASRERLEELYHFNEIEPTDIQEAWYNYNHQVPTYRRMEMIAGKADTFSIAKLANLGTEDEIDALTLARSWVRATALTPDDSWDPNIAAKKLTKLGLPLVDEALQSLIASKVITSKHRTRKTPGRSYEATDIMLNALKKHINETHFLEAANFKSFLDAEFRAGKPYVVFDHLSNEGAIMCITNLQAHSRIHLEGINIPMNKFGLTPDGSYETRKMDKSQFRFDLHIYPTFDYIFDSDIPTLNNLSSTPPRQGERGELPLWYTIAGDLMQDTWIKLFAAVAGTVALRTGVNTKGLKNAFSPALEEWEIRRVTKWGAERGVFGSVMEGVEGWTVNEWWWLIVGRLCEGIEGQRKEHTL